MISGFETCGAETNARGHREFDFGALVTTPEVEDYFGPFPAGEGRLSNITPPADGRGSA